MTYTTSSLCLAKIIIWKSIVLEIGPELRFFGGHQPQGVAGGVDRFLEQDAAGGVGFDELLQTRAADKQNQR